MGKQWEKDLIRDIRFHNYLDNIDDIRLHNYLYDIGFIIELTAKLVDGSIEFTDANHKALQKAMDFCSKPPKTFLEIGIHRNQGRSSTYTIFQNLPSDGIYLGVDIEDKSFLNIPTKGIYTIQTSSSNYEEVVNKLKFIGVEELDFIFIDGWHSINQVLDDWEYTKILSKGGVVAFHDTTQHLGPYCFINSLDTSKWDVYTNVCPLDYGFGYCKRK
jgi:hypothetical protein